MTYGYDGGSTLREHLAESFDTPEHAAFAIQMTTNPHWPREIEDKRFRPGNDADMCFLARRSGARAEDSEA